ncbi:hypothetical protein BGX27_003471, partial [Mortierella sp. AM989]
QNLPWPGPMEVFARPGLELQQGWGCIYLEELSLSLRWGSNSNKREERVQWKQICRQLGQLSKLRKLTLSIRFIEKGPESGIHELVAFV